MSRKFVVTLVLILFLLPIGSWYYLRSGLKWRKEAQAIMSGTTPFPSRTFHTTKGQKLDKTFLEEHVSLLVIQKCDQAQSQQQFLTELHDQFKQTGKAHFILLDTCQSDPGAMDTIVMLRVQHIINCRDTMNNCTALLDAWPADKHYALIDRNGIIRSYYTGQTPEEKKQLVEHMALLIPRERSEKVELKRGQ